MLYYFGSDKPALKVEYYQENDGHVYAVLVAHFDTTVWNDDGDSKVKEAPVDMDAVLASGDGPTLPMAIRSLRSDIYQRLDVLLGAGEKIEIEAME